MLWIVYPTCRLRGQKIVPSHLLTFFNFDELHAEDISWKSFLIKF